MGSNGSYVPVGTPEDVKFTDPTGQFQAGLDQFSNESNAMKALMAQYGGQATDALGRTQGYMDRAMQYDPNAYMNQFMSQQGGLASIAQDATSPLGRSLSAIAAREAALGGEAALAAMPGGRRSGAGMAAFADSYASPFAQAAAQTQQAQLGLTGNLWNQAMGLNADAQLARSSLAADMAAKSIALGGQYGSMMDTYGSLYGAQQANRSTLLQQMADLWAPTYEYDSSAAPAPAPAPATIPVSPDLPDLPDPGEVQRRGGGRRRNPYFEL